MTLEEYKEKTIGNIEMPEMLAKLFQYEEEFPPYYCNGFELSTDELPEMDIEEENLDKYLESIKSFGYTNSGSVAFWIKNASKVEESPIIYYSSDGDIKIVAKELKDFLRMLTFDVELSNGQFYKIKNDYVKNKGSEAYIKWIKKEFNLEAVSDLKEDERYGESEDIVQMTKEAEELYKEDFLEWHEEFCDIRDQYED